VLRRVAVRAPAAEAEIARARILELAPGGFEEVECGDEVEFAVYADGAGEATLRAVFEAVSSRVVDPGWDVRWREFHRPVEAGGLWIGPPWEPMPRDVTGVVIEPGRAFGTGAHPTTRACVELLATQERGSVLDAGCGSGVLAVAAVRLGFGPVVAVDLDPDAVACTNDNAARNGVALEVWLADVLRDELPVGDIVVANIELVVVETLLPRLPARRAITSGYLAGEAPFALGWDVRDSIELDGWAAHALEAS
jgi:ribosomal protein L11 methyltransferase